jgi:hypothetical protein
MKYLNAKQVLAVLEAARRTLLAIGHVLAHVSPRSAKSGSPAAETVRHQLTDGTIRIERAKGSVSGVKP